MKEGTSIHGTTDVLMKWGRGGGPSMNKTFSLSGRIHTGM